MQRDGYERGSFKNVPTCNKEIKSRLGTTEQVQLGNTNQVQPETTEQVQFGNTDQVQLGNTDQVQPETLIEPHGRIRRGTIEKSISTDIPKATGKIRTKRILMCVVALTVLAATICLLLHACVDEYFHVGGNKYAEGINIALDENLRSHSREGLEVSTNLVKKDADVQSVVNELNWQTLKSMVNVNISKTIYVDSSTNRAQLHISNTGFDGIYMKSNLTTGGFTLSTSLDGRKLGESFVESVGYETGSEMEEFQFSCVPAEYWETALLQCVIEDADGNVIYDSHGVPYGSTIETDTLQGEISKGEYTFTAKFYKYYVETGEKVGPAQTPVTVVVY